MGVAAAAVVTIPPVAMVIAVAPVAAAPIIGPAVAVIAVTIIAMPTAIAIVAVAEASEAEPEGGVGVVAGLIARDDVDRGIVIGVFDDRALDVGRFFDHGRAL